MTKPLYRLRADGKVVGPVRTKHEAGLPCRLVDHSRGFRLPVRVECLTCGEGFNEGDYLPCLTEEAIAKSRVEEFWGWV